MIDALGMIEVIGLIPAVAAADSAVKAADVHILKLYKVDGGIVTLAVTGDVGAVRAAVDAGTETARALGPVRAAHDLFSTLNDSSCTFAVTNIYDFYVSICESFL